MPCDQLLEAPADLTSLLQRPHLGVKIDLLFPICCLKACSVAVAGNEMKKMAVSTIIFKMSCVSHNPLLGSDFLVCVLYMKVCCLVPWTVAGDGLPLFLQALLHLLVFFTQFFKSVLSIPSLFDNIFHLPFFSLLQTISWLLSSSLILSSTLSKAKELNFKLPFKMV